MSRFKIGNLEGPTVWHMKLCSVLCGSLNGMGLGGGVDACICMAKSLHCSPDAITTLFVNHLYPNTN